MSFLRANSVFILVLLVASPLVAQNTDWIELFNGQTLDGWTQKGGQAKYDVVDGVIVGRTVPNTPNTFLCTEKNYSDFELELEFKVHPKLNSGIQIRSNSLKEYLDGRVHGYQIEIDPSDRAWSGGLYEEGRRGWLQRLSDNNAARYAFKQNDWNHYRIIAVGDHIRTWINGVPAADHKDSKTASGFIGLQVHGVGGRQDEITVCWKNIRLRENPSMPATVETKLTQPEQIFPAGARFKKLGTGYRFTEGPAVGPDGKIYFTDIPPARIHVYDPANGNIEISRENSGRANGLFWSAGQAMLVCEGGNRQISRTFAGQTKILAKKFEGKKFNSPNDLALDNAGGIYFTDPRYGNRDDMEMEIEGVYYLARNGKVSRVIDDLKRPNGLIFSPDFKTLYVADQAGGKTFAYDVTGDGKLENKTEFANVGSDGMSVDVHGNIYVTWKKDVIVFDAAGKELARITPPESPANCVLVGNTLYVTARTSFYAIPTLTQGVQ